ncbi:peroxin [Nannochloropsis oceanica]
MARPQAGSSSSSSTAGGDHGPTLVQKLVLLKDNMLKMVDLKMEKHPALTLRPQLLELEKKTNVPAPALFIIGSSLSVLILVLILSMEGVALAAGFTYPLLGSLKAIKMSEPVVMKFFIKYFLLYSLLNLSDTYLPIFPSLPLYYILKTLFLLWAFNPKTQGANIIYTALRPFLLPRLGIAIRAATAEASGQGGQHLKKSKKGEKAGGELVTAMVGTEGISATTATSGSNSSSSSSSGGESPTITLRIELAARGLEMPAEPERLDTLCQLRILPAGLKRGGGGGGGAGGAGKDKAERKPALDEGQWYKSRLHTSQPQDAPDWRNDPQFLRVPTLDDNVLEVLVVNKMSWKDQPLGRVRLPLKGLTFPVDTTLPLEAPHKAELAEEGAGGDDGEEGGMQGELEIHLELA